MLLGKIFYAVKPLIPRRIQLMLRRLWIRRQRVKYEHIWPIYRHASLPPDLRIKWPQDKQFALLLTHDVEKKGGHDKSKQLVQLEKNLGLQSAFYFVPRRYNVDRELRQHITKEGFEVGVHGLYHDGKLYNDWYTFQSRIEPINQYLKEWQAVGFSSPCAYHNLEWTAALDIKYSISTYDIDPFEPQGGGIGTIFPFIVINTKTLRRYVEIPYTLPQDFTLFVLMREKSIDIWKQKVDWIAQCGGLVHLKTHPDYMSFESGELGEEEYPISYYYEILSYIQQKYKGQYWHVLPKEMADFCLANTPRDENTIMPINSDILCPSCKSAIEQKKVLPILPRVEKATYAANKEYKKVVKYEVIQ